MRTCCRRRPSSTADTPAVRYKEGDAWVDRSFSQVLEIVRPLAFGLVALGIEKGDRVSILGNTRPEWTYFDFAALSIGATVVPIYQTNSPEECRYVLENSDAKVVVVEDDEQLAEGPRGPRPAAAAGARRADGRRAPTTRSRWTSSRPKAATSTRRSGQQRYDAVTPDDICTFIYTSGTTGPPKGCIISHGNYRAMLDMVNETSVIEEEDVTYLYLPLAHSFALLIQLGSFDLGADDRLLGARPAEDPPQPGRTETDLLPLGAAHLREDLHRRHQRHGERGRPQKGDLRLVDQGRREDARGRTRRPQAGLPAAAPVRLRRQESALENPRPVRRQPAPRGLRRGPDQPGHPALLRRRRRPRARGLGDDRDLDRGDRLLRPDDFKFGTIGKPFPGCEVKIAEDGEILVKGPNVFQGYHKNPEATAETIVDGWLHTGDIGEIDSEGFIKITGRKKDIIITAGGKNITPANLEAEIKQHPLVSQCVVVGDRRPYLVALVTLDPEEAVAYAKEHGLPEDPAAARHEPRRPQGLDRSPRRGDQQELRPRRAGEEDRHPPPRPDPGSGELTPTLKVKRAVVAQKHEDADRAALRGVKTAPSADLSFIRMGSDKISGGTDPTQSPRLPTWPHLKTTLRLNSIRHGTGFRKTYLST